MPAKGDSAYTPEKIREALTLVVTNQGNVREAARQAEVPSATLRRWMTETHVEEYADLDRRIGQQVEERVRRQALVAAEQAVEVELDLLAKLSEVQPRELPAALQAVASVKDKSIGKYLALSGRPSDGRQDGTAAVVAGLHHLIKRGLIKANVEIGPPPESVDGTAEELPEGSG